MASLATPLRLPPSMPPEILQEICQNLNQPDLKSCRLVSKHFSYVAEIFLFRQVLLKRNSESFARLRLVADHPRFSQLVKALCYSGMMLSESVTFKDFMEWSQIFADKCKFRYLRYTDAVRAYSKSLTSNQLRAHYEKYCAYLHSEQLVDNRDIETQHLTCIFAKLPRLEEVCFDRGKSYHLRVWGPGRPESFDQLSPIAREILVEPVPYGNSARHAGQLIGLLKAARALKKPLYTFKALGIPWQLFQRSDEMQAIMASTTSGRQHLTLDFCKFPARRCIFFSQRANIAQIATSSPFLNTIEVSFTYSGRRKDFNVRLSDIFDAGAHWPNLKHLKLQGLETASVSLVELLTSHATTLRFLELADIHLKCHQLHEDEFQGSWSEIIAFLQTSMSLQMVYLSEDITNTLDEKEVWDLPNSR